jgi:serine/threonine protein phosphatase PrpC
MTEDRWEPTRLYVDRQMVESDLLEIGVGSLCVYSSRSPEKQTPNEDAAAVIRSGADSGLLAVADGLGGAPAGQQAASLVLETLRAAVEAPAGEHAVLRTAILDGIEAANRAVLALGIGAATTLAVVEIQGATVRPYHVGDSMILVVGQRGKIKLRTTSHSPVGLAVASGFLDAEQAMHHEDRHLVSNVIGSAEMKIEIGPTLTLAPSDTVLLASDGLVDNLYVAEIVDRIRRGPLARAARRLVEDARRRMTHPQAGQPSKPDDLTFVLFRRRV